MRILAIIALFFSSYVLSHENVAINSANELEKWCAEEIQQYYFARQMKFTNWRASTKDKNGFWETIGKGRVDLDKVEVKCTVMVGGQQSHAKITLPDGTVLTPLDNDDDVILTEKKLRYWCKSTSHRYLAKRGLQPKRWTATTVAKENQLITRGVWRVGFERKHVECSVVRGAKAKYAQFEFR